MKNRGINQVYVLIDKSNGIENYLYEDLKKSGIPVYLLPHHNRLSHFKNIYKTISLIRKYKVDIVHTSLPFGNLVGQTAACLAGVKHRVTTCENASWAHDFNHKKQERLDQLTFRLAKRIIATSEIAADYLRRNWKFDKSKLRIIYHGLKPADYDVTQYRVESVKKQLQLDKKNEFVVGVVSRFEFWKGHEHIIEAANMLKAYPEIKFYIFGARGTYYEEAMKKINDLGLQEKVKYAGFVNDTSALYKLFDVHLHVPVNEFVETGGITIIEGMLAGRPQVLTRSGYAWQISEHMKNAYVVPFKNAQAIVDGIIWMKNNPEQAGKLVEQAQRDVSVFRVEKKADQHIGLYNELLDDYIFSYYPLP
jgi:glycosyltransferase involved in cell wall biosynthesis